MSKCSVINNIPATKVEALDREQTAMRNCIDLPMVSSECFMKSIFTPILR